MEGLRCSNILEAYSGRTSHLLNGAARRFTPGGFFLATAEPLALFVGYDGKAAEPGKPAVA